MMMSATNDQTNDLCDDLTAKLKHRTKLINMADRSVVDWETVAQYKTDPIIIDSDDGKKIRQAESKVLTKPKSKKSNKPTVCIHSQRPSGQQFWTENENNGVTPPNQRNFNFRFPLNSFPWDGYF